MNKISKRELLKRVEALEEENRQQGIAMFITLKCIQGNRLFTKDMRYCATIVKDKVLATHNFGGRVEVQVNTNIFGGFKQTDRDNTAVFMVNNAEKVVEKQVLDQSIFEGQDENKKFFAVDENGQGWFYEYRPSVSGVRWMEANHTPTRACGFYEVDDWMDSLVERKEPELIGSALTEKILESQRYQAAFVSDESEDEAINSQRTALIDNVYMKDKDYRFRAELKGFRYAVSINNQGGILKAKDVGL